MDDKDAVRQFDLDVLLQAADYLHQLGGGPMEDRLRLLDQDLRAKLDAGRAKGEPQEWMKATADELAKFRQYWSGSACDWTTEFLKIIAKHAPSGSQNEPPIQRQLSAACARAAQQIITDIENDVRTVDGVADTIYREMRELLQPAPSGEAAPPDRLETAREIMGMPAPASAPQPELEKIDLSEKEHAEVFRIHDEYKAHAEYPHHLLHFMRKSYKAGQHSASEAQSEYNRLNVERYHTIQDLQRETAALQAENERLTTVEENLADYARKYFNSFDIYFHYKKAQLVDHIKRIMVVELNREGATKDSLFDAVFKFLAEDGHDQIPTN